MIMFIEYFEIVTVIMTGRLIFPKEEKREQRMTNLEREVRTHTYTYIHTYKHIYTHTNLHTGYPVSGHQP